MFLEDILLDRMELPYVASKITELQGHPGSIWIAVMLSAVLLCFLVSEITRNYSQVDKLWSIMPVIYSVISLLYSPSPRVWIMSALVAIWGFRLSYNFNRKGGYSLIPWKGEEDYRWKIMRQHPALKGRLRFGLFNLFFISFYQHFLIFLFSSPLLVAAYYSSSDLTLTDLVAACLVVLFIALETVADNQQFRFHELKKQGGLANSPFTGSLKEGFLSAGLWKYVRHPNFVSEQAIWICFYLFGAAASGRWINWTITGPVLLVLLFQGSMRFTEKISSEKYPGYKDYQKKVPAFIPSFFRNRH